MRREIEQRIKESLEYDKMNELALKKIAKQLEEEFRYYQFKTEDISVEEFFGEEYSLWIFAKNRDWSFDERGTCTGSGGLLI